jgi:hypothetical protein
MPTGTHRKPTLADLAIVIAILALGMASLRHTLSSLPFSFFRRRRTAGGLRGSVDLYFEMALAHGVPLLVLASLAVVALSLRHPRPPLHRLARRPGFMVCLAVVVAAAGTIPLLGSAHLARGDLYPYFLVNVIVYGIVFNAGWMALGSWLTLALAGRRGRGQSRLDRFGLCLGSLWMILFAALWVFFILS